MAEILQEKVDWRTTVVAIAITVVPLVGILMLGIATFTWYYLWLFIFSQSITLLEGFAALKARDTALINRLAYSSIMLLRAGASVGLGLYLLAVLQSESLDPMWILLIVGTFAFAEIVDKRLAQKRFFKDTSAVGVDETEQ